MNALVARLCRRLLILNAVLCGLVRADVILDLTFIGNPGNPAYDHPREPMGSVGYSYYINTYEVTVAQYTEFLNAVAQSDPHGLYNPSMSAGPLGPYIMRYGEEGAYYYSVVEGKENQPVRHVSFFDAVRFANWMHNGQGDGDTETGSYDLTGPDWWYVTRGPGATWVVPTLDEWFKAAYYDPVNERYWMYPNGSDDMPEEPTDETSPRVFNFGDTPFWQGTVVFTSVGDTTGQSPYGTYDQGGNVEEWLEDVLDLEWRGLRGGHAFSSAGPLSAESFGTARQPHAEGDGFGFRLVLIPEPSTTLLLLLGGALVYMFKRR